MTRCFRKSKDENRDYSRPWENPTRYLGLVVFLCALTPLEAALGQAVKAAHAVREFADLAYYAGPDADPHKHKLDLYVPNGLESPPTLVWIHGGAWVKGDRKEEEALARQFAQLGIAVAAISYRLSPGTWLDPSLVSGIQHPEHMKDCARAVAWLKRHAGDYGLDPGKLVVGGYSAGAHMSALLATDDRWLQAERCGPEDIRAAVAISGAYDMQSYYDAHLSANGRELADGHVLEVFGRSPDVLREVSPTTYLHEMTTPMLVISEQDTADYTRLLEEAVSKLPDKDIKFKNYPEETHASLYDVLARDWFSPPRQEVVDFILRITGSSPEGP